MGIISPLSILIWTSPLVSSKHFECLNWYHKLFWHTFVTASIIIIWAWYGLDLICFGIMNPPPVKYLYDFISLWRLWFFVCLICFHQFFRQNIFECLNWYHQFFRHKYLNDFIGFISLLGIWFFFFSIFFECLNWYHQFFGHNILSIWIGTISFLGIHIWMTLLVSSAC